MPTSKPGLDAGTRDLAQTVPEPPRACQVRHVCSPPRPLAGRPWWNRRGCNRRDRVEQQAREEGGQGVAEFRCGRRRRRVSPFGSRPAAAHPDRHPHRHRRGPPRRTGHRRRLAPAHLQGTLAAVAEGVAWLANVRGAGRRPRRHPDAVGVALALRRDPVRPRGGRRLRARRRRRPGGARRAGLRRGRQVSAIITADGIEPARHGRTPHWSDPRDPPPTTTPGSSSPPDPPAPPKASPSATATPPRSSTPRRACSCRTTRSGPATGCSRDCRWHSTPPARRCGWRGGTAPAWCPLRGRWCAAAWTSARGWSPATSASSRRCPRSRRLWPAEALEAVRLLIFGGEACPPELAERLAVDRPRGVEHLRPHRGDRRRVRAR